METYERNKLTVTIEYDDNAESPRQWDNLGTMICSHPDYILGDEQFKPEDYEGWQDLKQHLIKNEDAAIVLPLGLYDHSGITMYVGVNHDQWDGGQVGVIYTTETMITSYFGQCDEASKELAEECLRSEVATYDQYLTGDVYGYIITNPKTGEKIDALWGLYGLDDCKQAANEEADAYKHPHEAAYAKKASDIHG